MTAEASKQEGTPVETETKNNPSWTGEWVRLRPHSLFPDQLVIERGRGGTFSSFGVTLSELRTIVQLAYDQHGILAEPSIEVERQQYEARKAEAEDTHLRSFADAWGRSARGDRAW